MEIFRRKGKTPRIDWADIVLIRQTGLPNRALDLLGPPNIVGLRPCIMGLRPSLHSCQAHMMTSSTRVDVDVINN
ncbi:hypothetical protein M5689_012405 [Euphorbia peplus]|nr:hypothetical protein M5689_012405 [Euphorbia peplus]